MREYTGKPKPLFALLVLDIQGVTLAFNDFDYKMLELLTIRDQTLSKICCCLCRRTEYGEYYMRNSKDEPKVKGQRVHVYLYMYT